MLIINKKQSSTTTVLSHVNIGCVYGLSWITHFFTVLLDSSGFNQVVIVKNNLNIMYSPSSCYQFRFIRLLLRVKNRTNSLNSPWLFFISEDWNLEQMAISFRLSTQNGEIFLHPEDVNRPKEGSAHITAENRSASWSARYPFIFRQLELFR